MFVYLAIRQSFTLSRMTTNNYINPIKSFAVTQDLPFLNNPKDLDPSYKMDLDFWDCLGKKKKLL